MKVGSCFKFGPGKEGEVETRHMGYRAGYGDVEVFRRTMWGYAYHRGLGLEGKAVVSGDGASWIDGFAEMYCPKRVHVVDWYHLGREAFGEEAAKWVENVKQKLWEGEVEQVIQECEKVVGRNSNWEGRSCPDGGVFSGAAKTDGLPGLWEGGVSDGKWDGGECL